MTNGAKTTIVAGWPDENSIMAEGLYEVALYGNLKISAGEIDEQFPLDVTVTVSAGEVEDVKYLMEEVGLVVVYPPVEEAEPPEDLFQDVPADWEISVPCPHGRAIEDCDYCYTAGDLAYDAAREIGRL